MRLSAVTLLVPSYEQGLAFWRDAMGFVVLTDADMGGGKRFLVVAPDRNATGFVLAVPANDQQQQALGNQTGGRVAFFIQTDDFARAYAQMRANGVLFCEAPRHEPYGIVVVFKDPFGNRYDLIQPNPL